MVLKSITGALLGIRRMLLNRKLNYACCNVRYKQSPSSRYATKYKLVLVHSVPGRTNCLPTNQLQEFRAKFSTERHQPEEVNARIKCSQRSERIQHSHSVYFQGRVTYVQFKLTSLDKFHDNETVQRENQNHEAHRHADQQYGYRG